MDKALVEKLTALEGSLAEIELELQKMDISSDPNAYAELAKRHSDVSAIVVLFNQWRTLNGDIADAEEHFFGISYVTIKGSPLVEQNYNCTHVTMSFC